MSAKGTAVDVRLAHSAHSPVRDPRSDLCYTDQDIVLHRGLDQ
jgi:hypothetical protein